MTNQHRATPEQWKTVEIYAEDGSDEDNATDSCLLELRDRIEQLEAAQRPNPAPTGAPTGSLVERVADAIAAEPFLSSPTPVRKARAAIREVAAAVIEWHDSDQLIRTAWEAGKWLEQEANR